jgi:hypothetical protein
MEKFGSSYDDSFNKSRFSSNSFTFPTRNNTRSNTPMMIYDDVDIDKYMSIVEVELKKLGYSLENRAFIANIINILDKLIEPKKFNKTIFFHILDFANLNRDSPILILDFFRSFFTVYESMKKNREKFAEEILNSNGKIQTTKNKIMKFQKEEKVLENGLTNYSSIKIELLISKIETYALNQNNGPSNTKPTINIKFKVGKETKSIDINSLKRKTSFNVDSMELIENPLKIFIEINGREHYIEKINIRNILDQEYFFKFSHQGMTFDLGFLWINSRVNYYNKLISRLEAKIEENKENINVLNNCISHIEETFKKYFGQLGIGNSLSNSSSAVSLNVTGFKAGTMEKELQISQSIEDYVLKIVGKEVFVMDKIVFLFNKILILLLIFVFLQRHDTVTVRKEI